MLPTCFRTFTYFRTSFFIHLQHVFLMIWVTFFQRILVATNLFGRGMDIERVNIVFNYDMPEDSDTYLHRVARAGRFGTKVGSCFRAIALAMYSCVECIFNE